MTDVIKREKTFAEQIDDCLNGKMNEYENLKVGDTPSLFTVLGCEQLTVLYSQKNLRDAIKPKNDILHHHGLTVDFIKRVPEMMASPVMVMDSLTRRDSMIAVLSSKEFDSDGFPIIMALRPNGEGIYEMENIDSNFVLSIYGRKGFESFFERVINEDKLLYFDNKKSQELFSSLRLQLPQALNTLDPNSIIHQSRNIVNRSEEKNKENTQKDSLAYINEQSKPMIVTQYDSLSIEEFMDKTNTISKRALALDTTNMTADNISAENIKLMKDYLVIKQITNDACQAQKFLAESTQVFCDGERIRLMSAMPASKYSEAVHVLTNDMNKDFMFMCAKNDMIEKDYEISYIKLKEREQSFKATNTEEYMILDKHESVTIAQLMKVIEEMKAEQEKMLQQEKSYEQEKYQLEKQYAEQKYYEEKYYEEQKQAEKNADEPTLGEKMVKAMSDMMMAGALYEVTSKSLSEIENGEKLKNIGTAAIPSIVLKGGGYAYRPQVEQGKDNTVAVENLISAQLTAYDEYVPDVMNPIETTNDSSKVGGNVQHAGIQMGSLERKQEEAMPVTVSKFGKSTKLEIEM